MRLYKNNFSKRTLAFLIDLVAISQIAVIADNFIALNHEISTSTVFNLEFSYGYSFSFVLFLLYFMFFDLFYNGRTLGKKIVSLDTSAFVNLSIKQRLYVSFLKTGEIMLFPITIFMLIFYKTTPHEKFMERKFS